MHLTREPLTSAHLAAGCVVTKVSALLFHGRGAYFLRLVSVTTRVTTAPTRQSAVYTFTALILNHKWTDLQWRPFIPRQFINTGICCSQQASQCSPPGTMRRQVYTP